MKKHYLLLSIVLAFLLSSFVFSSQKTNNHLVTTKYKISQVKDTNQNITWLGADCSLYRFKSNVNIAQDEKLKEVLLKGHLYFNNRHMNYKQLASWLNKERSQVINNYEFGMEQTKLNLAKYWILPECECYYLRQNDISKYIKTLSIQEKGIALILLPESTDAKFNYSWVVFFDMESKDVIWMDRYHTARKLNVVPRRGHFGTEWLAVMKNFVDNVYPKL
jgi:hypothetical protein